MKTRLDIEFTASVEEAEREQELPQRLNLELVLGVFRPVFEQQIAALRIQADAAVALMHAIARDSNAVRACKAINAFCKDAECQVQCEIWKEPRDLSWGIHYRAEVLKEFHPSTTPAPKPAKAQSFSRRKLKSISN